MELRVEKQVSVSLRVPWTTFHLRSYNLNSPNVLTNQLQVTVYLCSKSVIFKWSSYVKYIINLK